MSSVPNCFFISSSSSPLPHCFKAGGLEQSLQDSWCSVQQTIWNFISLHRLGYCSIRQILVDHSIHLFCAFDKKQFLLHKTCQLCPWARWKERKPTNNCTIFLSWSFQFWHYKIQSTVAIYTIKYSFERVTWALTSRFWFVASYILFHQLLSSTVEVCKSFKLNPTHNNLSLL